MEKNLEPSEDTAPCGAASVGSVTNVEEVELIEFRRKYTSPGQ
jgi:hypothetical protein